MHLKTSSRKFAMFRLSAQTLAKKGREKGDERNSLFCKCVCAFWEVEASETDGHLIVWSRLQYMLPRETTHLTLDIARAWVMGDVHVDVGWLYIRCCQFFRRIIRVLSFNIFIIE